VSTHISLRIPYLIDAKLDALCARLGLSRTDAILNALLVQFELFEPAPGETPKGNKSDAKPTPTRRRSRTAKHA